MPARKRYDLLREIRGTVGKEHVAEFEYGMKEFFQGLFVGFIIGFLTVTYAPSVPSVPSLLVLFIFAAALAIADAIKPLETLGGRRKVSTEAEVEYGLKEFLLGILVGLLLGMLVTKVFIL